MSHDTMKALVLNANWEPKNSYAVSEKETMSGKAINANMVWRNPTFSFNDVPIPPILEDEVLVKIKACGVCGSDTHCYETDKDGYVIFSGPVKLPVILGHEYSGEVVLVGKNVTTLQVGDPVAPEGMLWCGICTVCRSGHYNQCRHLDMVGFSSPGAYAEYIVVKEKYCWKLTDLAKVTSNEMEMYELGALIEPIGCAYNGMFISGGGFRPGAYVAIFGAGPIGIGALLMAQVAGASKIFVFDTSEVRCQIARDMGADFVGNTTYLKENNTSPSEVIMDLTFGQGADMQVEAAGAGPHTLPEIEKSFAPNGKMIYLGRAGTRVEMYLDVLVSQANGIVGSRGHAGYGVYPNIIRILSTGRYPALKMVTSRYPFVSVMDAIKKSSLRTDGKIMIQY